MKNSRHHASASLGRLVFIVVVACVVIVSCGDNDTPSAPVDMMTSATPGVADIVLTNAHTGWAKSGCTSCHGETIRHWMSEDQCASCHGPNGAPLRAVDHQDSECLDCHVQSHIEESFNDDNSCRSCHGYVETDGCSHRELYDVVIIGGGGGGLAAAATLLDAGRSVALIEQHYKVGGNIVSFRRGDYRFEGTLHALTSGAVNDIRRYDTEDKIAAVSSETMYQVVAPDFSLNVPEDVEEYRDIMTASFPEEAVAIDSLFNTMTEMDFARVAGMSLSQAMESHGISNAQVSSSFSILSFFMAQIPDRISAGAFMGMWNSYHRDGYHYIVGGSETILDVMSSYIAEKGGTIKLSTRVEHIIVEDERVTSVKTSDGGCYEADYFISNASIPSTYIDLIGEEHLPEDVIQRIESVPAAASDITVYLGVSQDYTGYFSGGNHEIWILEDYDTSAEYWNENRCDPSRIPLVLSNHSVFDDGAAPPGQNALTLSAQLEYDCNDNWGWDESYDGYLEFRDRVAQVFIERAERVLPELSAHVEVMDVSSPHTLERFTLSPGGSWAGFEARADDPISWNEEERHRSLFPNLFFAGSWASGGGIGRVIDSGRLAASLILAE